MFTPRHTGTPDTVLAAEDFGRFEGGRALVPARGTSLRALITYLGNLSNEEVSQLEIQTGIPLVYRFSDKLGKPRRQYLG